MFKLGDKVKYVGSCYVAWEKWAHNQTGIIIDILNKKHVKVKYKEKFHGKDDWWIYTSELQHVIPEYILDWEKRLDV